VSVHKSGDFIADVEQQVEWYAVNAGWEVADRYLAAVEATCNLLSEYPLLGARGTFTHQRLRDWRFIVVLRPFNKHVLFYEVIGGEAMMRRAMHGQRDLPHRLLEPPGAA
jgi:plasmid stabilization system protein ParE